MLYLCACMKWPNAWRQHIDLSIALVLPALPSAVTDILKQKAPNFCEIEIFVAYCVSDFIFSNW